MNEPSDGHLKDVIMATLTAAHIVELCLCLLLVLYPLTYYSYYIIVSYHLNIVCVVMICNQAVLQYLQLFLALVAVALVYHNPQLDNPPD